MFIPTDPSGDMMYGTRLPRVLGNCLLGDKVEGVNAQYSDHSGSHGGRFDAVFHGYLHLPLRDRDDPDSWTGKCGRSSPDRTQ
jgi:hypothetical protein